MNATSYCLQSRLIARAICGMLAASFLWFAGIGLAAPEIRWSKSYVPRVWKYTGGGMVTAAYDSYKNGEVTLITDIDEKQAIEIKRLSERDQTWVLEELKKPHGLINDVVFGQWQDQCPLFRINTSFFTKGNLTVSPVVCVQYLFLDRQKRAVKRICEPVTLYPTVGKQNLELMGTMVMSQCLGPKEPDNAGAKMQAYRAVMLLLSDNKKEWLVLDVISKQNDMQLRELGIPKDWWEPRYPFGTWSLPFTGGDAK